MKFTKRVFSILFVLILTFVLPAECADFNRGEVVAQKQTQPSVIVIFGATGDLTVRKLYPAIYHLAREGYLSESTAVVGIGRRDYTDDIFRDKMFLGIEKFSEKHPDFQKVWGRLRAKTFYHKANFSEDSGYEQLKTVLGRIDKEQGTAGNRIFYLSTQPAYFSTIVSKLDTHGLIYDVDDKRWSRVMIEKPFGYDLNSAIELQEEISRHLNQSQIYRVDHYLGKEGVHNLLSLRFENGLFEPLWNSQYIDNVQITVSEDIGIGTRANFWEGTGYLRDVFQNHIIQLLAIAAMEKPEDLTAESIHTAKLDLLKAIRPDRFIRGQYAPGNIKGQPVAGYLQEEGVPENSQVETYVAAKLFVDNNRWNGVPFYIRGGKRLPKRTAEIVVTFKKEGQSSSNIANAIIIRIQPEAGIFFKMEAKEPGIGGVTQPVVFGYTPESYFNKISPDAYEKLFYDCIKGDSDLFVEGEEQIAAWRLLTPVLDEWKGSTTEKVHGYPAGTWGPQEADQMLQKDGREWQLLEKP